MRITLVVLTLGPVLFVNCPVAVSSSIDVQIMVLGTHSPLSRIERIGILRHGSSGHVSPTARLSLILYIVRYHVITSLRNFDDSEYLIQIRYFPITSLINLEKRSGLRLRT